MECTDIIDLEISMGGYFAITTPDKMIVEEALMFYKRGLKKLGVAMKTVGQG